MKIVETKKSLRSALRSVPGEGVKFVPTMGALHEGHMSLVRAARESGGMVVVSIFVNPTQFNDPADLQAYPRTPEQDLAMLEAEGVDVVFVPTVEEIYPEPDTRVFDFGELGGVMEGATRPGHFNGVAQVVSRLFDLVRPRAAFFGQKDYQQVAIVRELVRLAREEHEPWAMMDIVECPTARDADGLALSSRNALLTPEHRAAAPDIYRALRLGALKAAELSPREVGAYVTAEIERSGLLKVIYFDMMGTQACVAVQAGGVRLIDNMRYDN